METLTIPSPSHSLQEKKNRTKANIPSRPGVLVMGRKTELIDSDWQSESFVYPWGGNVYPKNRKSKNLRNRLIVDDSLHVPDMYDILRFTLSEFLSCLIDDNSIYVPNLHDILRYTFAEFLSCLMLPVLDPSLS